MTDKQKVLLPMNLQFFAEGKDVVEEVSETTDIQIEAEVVTEVVGEKLQEATEKIELPEIKIVTPVDNTVEIATLESKIAELTTQLAEAQSKNIELTAVIEESGKSVETATQQAETYQKSLETIVAEKEKEIPEDLKALMPTNVSVTEKLEWLTKAETLKPKQEEKAEVITAIGRPTPVTEQVVDQSELSAFQKMSNYFGSK